MFPGWPSILPSVTLHGYHFVCSAQQKLWLPTNYHACIVMPTWFRCAPPILFWPWPAYNLFPMSLLTSIFIIDLNWWVSLCVQSEANAMHFQQIYRVCIAMPTWCRCAPPILFWSWTPFNILFPRSCLNWIVDNHWWVPHCEQWTATAMQF